MPNCFKHRPECVCTHKEDNALLFGRACRLVDKTSHKFSEKEMTQARNSFYIPLRQRVRASTRYDALTVHLFRRSKISASLKKYSVLYTYVFSTGSRAPTLSHSAPVPPLQGVSFWRPWGVSITITKSFVFP